MERKVVSKLAGLSVIFAIELEIHASMINNVATNVVGSSMENAHALELVNIAVPVRNVAAGYVAMQADAVAGDLMKNARPIRSVATGNA